MLSNVQRIAILGCGGSGKTTLAKKLAATFSLPLYHLDQYYWKAGWVEPNLNEYSITHQNLCTQEKWVIDGTQTRFMHDRLPLADLIIFLDRPRLLCLGRMLKRWFKHRKKRRSDLPIECNERVTWGFVRYILRFNDIYRPQILNLCHQLKTSKLIYILTTDQEITDFLKLINPSLSNKNVLQKYEL